MCVPAPEANNNYWCKSSQLSKCLYMVPTINIIVDGVALVAKCMHCEGCIHSLNWTTGFNYLTFLDKFLC